MPTSPDELDQALREALPVREGLLEMALANADAPTIEREDEPGARIVTLRFIVYDGAEVRDIKEQEVLFAPDWAMGGDTPVTAFVAGWAAALREVFARSAPSMVDMLLPHDLVPVGALELRGANTADDFKAACLKKSRLGRYLTS